MKLVRFGSNCVDAPQPFGRYCVSLGISEDVVGVAVTVHVDRWFKSTRLFLKQCTAQYRVWHAVSPRHNGRDEVNSREKVGKSDHFFR